MEQDGRAYIILNRAASGVMRHDDFDILVNDSRIDTIKEGEEKTLTLKPGWNRISLSRGLMKSKPLVFKMSDGMIINLECGCSMNLLTAPFELLYECVTPGHCLFLRRTFIPYRNRAEQARAGI